MKDLKYFFLTLLFIGTIITVNGQIWVQTGNDIDGEASNDDFGRSVSISSNGSIVAIGAPGNTNNSISEGYVKVYQNTGGIWAQIGLNIYGKVPYDHLGKSICLNDDGSVIAISAKTIEGNEYYNDGSVRIYKNNSGSWEQVGEDIGDSQIDNGWFGYSVSLSSDGSVVAVGAPISNEYGSMYGLVRVYKNVSGNWEQIGEDIFGEASFDEVGWSVSLSSDGTVLAVGARKSGSIGYVRVYEITEGSWAQLGGTIYGEAIKDWFGYSVSLNSDASIVAVGGPWNDGNGDKAGHTRIYENNSGNWIQIGDDIDGEAIEDMSGYPVSLNSEGSIIAIGAIGNDGNGSNSGHVRIFENIEGVWEQIGEDIEGEAEEDYFFRPSLSSDGSIVVIGGHRNDGNGIDAGHARVYNLVMIPVIINQPESQTNICPGDEAVFSINVDNIGTYQWQVRSNNGIYWSDISNNTTYSGSTTNTLIITTNLGLNNYQYQCVLTNEFGNTISNPVNLIFDTEAPTIISTHPDQIIIADDNCEIILDNYTGFVSAFDNCTESVNLSISQLPIAGTTIIGATNSITLTVSDELGNETEILFNIGISDVTDPVITSTHNDQNLDAGENCTAILPDYSGNVTVTDNCSTSFDIIQSPDVGTPISGKNNQITLTIKDEAGNEDMARFNVKVIDNIKPIIACVGKQEVDVGTEGSYRVVGTEFHPINTDDNCGVINITNNFNGSSTLAGAVFPRKSTTIVWTVSDAAGNKADCRFEVIVNSLLIYPNPTRGVLNLEFGNQNIQKIKVSDIRGKTLLKKTEIQQTETIDLSKFSTGLYIVRIYMDGDILIKKIVKK